MGEGAAVETIRRAAREAPRWRVMLVGAIAVFLLAGAIGITWDGAKAFVEGVTGHRDITIGWVIDSLAAIYPAAATYCFRNEWARVIRFLLLAKTPR